MMRSRTAVVVCFVALLSLATAKKEQIEFKIVPNTAGNVEVALDTPPIAGSTCKFEWEAHGATTELWTAEVSGDPGSGDLACEISRLGGKETYLMFKKFKTTLGTSPIIDAELHGNDGIMTDAHVTEGECIKNNHDWPGGVIRKIKLTSMVDI